ncbi:hypothetical protein CK203_012330 [Vitis vinifera]|uniref:Uncharacterized protein n=1 Tax=Vitis vinifera TaxID=29760 RepID=A0A438JLC8_VITVI|nr:hypothetical protein CK203_012330 [Vitis vinifera]
MQDHHSELSPFCSFFSRCFPPGFGSNSEHPVLVYSILKSRFHRYLDCSIHLHEFAHNVRLLEDMDWNRTLELPQGLRA